MQVACNVIPYADEPGVCDRCRTPLKGRQRRWCSRKCSLAYQRNHMWSAARTAAKRRDKWTCRACGARRGDGAALEVNHIEPRLGQGYGWGCWHHLDNLETVCRTCHLLITAQQRASRKSNEHYAIPI